MAGGCAHGPGDVHMARGTYTRAGGHSDGAVDAPTAQRMGPGDASNEWHPMFVVVTP